MEPVKAPWIRPAVVVHDPQADVDELLAEFALDIRARGFRVAGLVQLNNRQVDAPGSGCADEIELFDLSSGEAMRVRRGGTGETSPFLGIALASLRAALRDDADLVVISRFGALEQAASRLMTAIENGIAQGLPVLTSIAGRCLDKWNGFSGARGALLPPEIGALWQWWGAERLYRDLALGVAEHPVRRIVCGPRWLMIEGLHGVGLAHLPKGPAALVSRLPQLHQKTLRELAELTLSWDALEMAVGIAAINAHYNRFDLDVAFGNGVHTYRGANGRVVVVGAFPGLPQILPAAQVIEAQPRPGELPAIAMETVLPGCAAAVVNSSAIINRTLPRILRLTHGSRVALIGPSTPMTPRLHTYGVDILGGLRVRDVDGLAEAVAAGGLPRDFDRFGDYVHIGDRTTRVTGSGKPARGSPAAETPRGCDRGRRVADGQPVGRRACTA